MNYIYAYESVKETDKAIESCRNIIKASEKYRQYLVDEYELLHPAASVVFTKAEYANNVFGQSPLPAYNNGSRIVLSPDKKEWSNLYRDMFMKYKAPEDLIEYFYDFGEKEIMQAYFHEITHDIDLFVADYGSERDDFWFEEGMCEYLSFRYIYDDEEFSKLIEMMSKMVEFYEREFGRFDVELFDDDIYVEKNVAYLLSFYAKAFLQIDKYVKQCGSPKKLFEIYDDWWNNDSKLTLDNWIKEKLN